MKAAAKACLVCIAVAGFLLLAQGQSDALIHDGSSAPSREDLERQKLRLEIEKLRREAETMLLSPVLQAGTLLVAFITVAISVWTAARSHARHVRTLEVQVEQNHQARMSELLRELGSRQPAVRAAAVQALSRYPEGTSFLVHLLEVEENATVLEAIEISLLRGGNQS